MLLLWAMVWMHAGEMECRCINPMYMDDVAVDFPEMKIILAHPSFPWQEEALAVAQHKPNVYIDLSGWSPKYFPEILIKYCNSILRKKVLFGSDWPMISPERWLSDFEKMAYLNVSGDIMEGNAARLLLLTEGAASSDGPAFAFGGGPLDIDASPRKHHPLIDGGFRSLSGWAALF